MPEVRDRRAGYAAAPGAGRAVLGEPGSWYHWGSGPSPTCRRRRFAPRPGPVEDDLAVLDPDGLELIARALFEPLARAGRPAGSGGLERARGRKEEPDMSQGRAAFYLQIPAQYCRSFGGLRWAQYGEAVEFLEGPAAGRTFAFAAEIDAFLEGLVDAGGSLPGFGFVLHLLYLSVWEIARPATAKVGRRASSASPRRSGRWDVRCATPGHLCSWLSREAPLSRRSPRPGRTARDHDRRKLGSPDGPRPSARWA